MARDATPSEGGGMKSLMSLVREILQELGDLCRTSTIHDLEYVMDRIEHEGLSFLTITLPTFGKDLQKGLDQGWVDRSLFLSFRKKGRTGELPRFLGGFLGLVFDRNTGLLLDEPSIDAIFALRQFTLMFEKILLPCSDERVNGAMLGYLKCEQDVKAADAMLQSAQKDHFVAVSTRLFGQAFAEVDQQILNGEIVPKHGPGATADKLLGNQKFQQSEWTSRLEEHFPMGEFLLPSWRYHEDLANTDILEPGAERPVRVISVPKTLKTPRIIAVEPTATQYVQQGIAEALVKSIDRDYLLSTLIGFDDQDPNRKLALQGSMDGTLATLDLSEASDRVSNQHVRLLFAHHSLLREGVDACRSRKADVLVNGEHRIVRLAKFASMGSALTFPIEAMVFTTIIFMGIENALSRRLTDRDIKSLIGRVRVFGDDIIVPVDYVQPVIDVMTTFGYVVNVNKSFWTGKFRESCGKEYYGGHDVSIVKVRRPLPEKSIRIDKIQKLRFRARQERVQEIISTVSLRNQLYKAGLWSTAKFLDDLLEGVLRHFPAIAEDSPVLGRVSFSGYDSQKTHRHLHSPLVKGYVVTTDIPSDPLDGSGALLKYFLKRSDLPFADRKHLERAGRPESLDIKLRWASPF